MAPPKKPWFRFYVEAVYDRKLRRLTPGQRWLWVAILAAARQSCIPGYLLVSEREPMDEHDLADVAGMTPREVAKALPLMEQVGMIERDAHLGCWAVTNWADRQFESDETTKRTRKHRAKTKGDDPDPPPNGTSKEQRWNVPSSSMERRYDVNGTPPETETETETDTEVLTSSDNDDQEVPHTGSSSRTIGSLEYEQALALVALVARADRHDLRSPGAFIKTVMDNTDRENGPAIRQRLEAGDTPEQAIEHVLGIDRFTLANARRTAS